MIIFIEGTRNSGKTYLLTKLMERHGKELGLFYYKFYLAQEYSAIVPDWQKSDKGIHYFSMGNIMTILDMHQQFPDKIFVFDRAYITAAAWAIIWNRLTDTEAVQEVQGLISRPGYTNCKTVFIQADDLHKQDGERTKDLWDGLVSPSQELATMTKLLDEAPEKLYDPLLNNGFALFTNTFNEESVDEFCSLIQQLIQNK